ncbi:tRNA (guanine(9)-N(1))-methyltransferase [Aspergillus chevalieri]|uniref:tRNA (guanine(9)-N1)-methyltransferase n=1 Tax=Aspergillus chevalieri TaxID=182096 RepID=A0A7R7VNG9_ASPCH|nr:tRNA (guanine(9)-N(1))-methyltransferase [Aspergillus chevalieri]BCR87824.1 tRNA (guanine(9)-N(1))-methyltransferase [Aspergillus chevalieri]
MDEEERPRKQQKLDTEGQKQEENMGPAMTGAVGEEKVDDHATTATHNGNENKTTSETGDGEHNESETAGHQQHPEGAAPTMSKNQLKKLRRKEAWDAKADERRAKRKEENAAKKQRKKNLLEEAKKQGKEAEEAMRKKFASTRQRHHQSTLVPLTFVMDCGFDELMMDKERISLGSQLTRAYSDNSRSKYRVHYVISSFDKQLRERFDTVLKKTYLNWRGVRTMQEDYVHAAEMAKVWMTGPEGGKLAGRLEEQSDAKPGDGEVIYLSSDSPNTLTELKPYSTYIIGGLVDKNRHKGICHKQATERGIKTAKLPIGDYIQMASRSVLATNHVMEIMLRWLETGNWGEAFMQVIPQRKGGKLKGKAAAGEGSPTNEYAEGIEEDGDDGEDNDAEASEAAQGEIEQRELHATAEQA